MDRDAAAATAAAAADKEADARRRLEAAAVAEASVQDQIAAAKAAQETAERARLQAEQVHALQTAPHAYSQCVCRTPRTPWRHYHHLAASNAILLLLTSKQGAPRDDEHYRRSKQRRAPRRRWVAWKPRWQHARQLQRRHLMRCGARRALCTRTARHTAARCGTCICSITYSEGCNAESLAWKGKDQIMACINHACHVSRGI